MLTGKPTPERFLQYEEAADGSGFYLPTGEYFEFDQFGGWYDENGWYYKADGTPSDPPAKLTGKNRGFGMPAGGNHSSSSGYQGGHKGGYSAHDNSGYVAKGSGGYGGGSSYNRDRNDRNDRNYGNRRNNNNNRNRRRRRDDDDDDDPVLKEFGGDFADDDEYLEEVTTNKEDQEKLERAYQLEQKKEKLTVFLSETILKEKISFTVEFVKIKSDSSSILEGAKELVKKHIPEAVVEPRSNQSGSGSSLVAKVHVKTKEQAYALLNLEGESVQNIRVENIDVPVLKPEDEEAEIEPKDEEEGSEEGEEEDEGEGEEEQEKEAGGDGKGQGPGSN